MEIDPPVVGGAWFHGWLTIAIFNPMPPFVLSRGPAGMAGVVESPFARNGDESEAR
jgi:hypothetical protein